MDLTVALRTFARVVERGSLTAAAKDLGVSQPAVTKLVQSLERRAGARLLERSSRALRPTPQGRVLYERSGDALSALDAALEAVRNKEGLVEGRLRVHAPACLGERHLSRIAMAFQDQHPAVTIDLTLENRPVDVIAADFDVALTMARPKGQGLIARRIGESTRVLVASPDYLRRRGPIKNRRVLADHDLIVTDASLPRPGRLVLRRMNATVEIDVKPVLTTNSARVLVDALKAGRGVGTAQLFLVDRDLAEGSLVRVLATYQVQPTDLFLVYASSRFVRPTVRAFIDVVVPALRRVEGIV